MAAPHTVAGDGTPAADGSADGLDAVLRELPIACHDWQVVDERGRNDDPEAEVKTEKKVVAKKAAPKAEEKVEAKEETPKAEKKAPAKKAAAPKKETAEKKPAAKKATAKKEEKAE